MVFVSRKKPQKPQTSRVKSELCVAEFLEVVESSRVSKHLITESTLDLTKRLILTS